MTNQVLVLALTQLPAVMHNLTAMLSMSPQGTHVLQVSVVHQWPCASSSDIGQALS